MIRTQDNAGLTNACLVAMIARLSQKAKAGPSTPNNGHKRPLKNSGFFSPIKKQSGINPFYILYGGLCGAGENLAGSVTGVENPIQSATRLFSTIGGGYPLYNGVTAMNNHTQTPGNPAQNPAIHAPHDENSASLNQAVNQCVKLLERHSRSAKIAIEMLTAMAEDVELFRDAAIRLQAAMPEKHEPQPFKINPPRRVSVDDLIKQRNQEMGLEPLPLESDLLLQRIAQGGHSGQFLADAFISAYRTNQPFTHSLGELMKLDAEGFRLFHEILHIRYISGWNDDGLYQIEQQVIALVGGAL